MNVPTVERNNTIARRARAMLLSLGLGLLTACTPTPPVSPPVKPAAPEQPAARAEAGLTPAVELTRQTLQAIVDDYVVPIPAGELRSRFMERLHEQLSEGPWRDPLPASNQSLENILGEFQQRSPDQPILPAVEAALEQIVAGLGNSGYLSRERVRFLERRGSDADGSIGVQLRQGSQGVVINDVFAGSPAERSGLSRGDRLLKINGESTTDILLEEVAVRLRDVPGTQVTLTVEFANGEQQVLNLQREKVEETPVEGRWLTRGIAYVRVRTLSENSVEAFNQVFLDLLRKVGAPRGLVLDLRDNSGGLLEATARLADTFLTRGPILQVRGRPGGEVVRMMARPGSEVFERKLPMVVLINDYTISGAEAIAAALQDHRRAVVVGRSRSYGQGRVYTVISLPQGRLLKLATGTLSRASGQTIEDRGVVPDLCVGQATLQVVPRAAVIDTAAQECPYREMSGPVEDEALLSAAIELLADRGRYRQILQRGETAEPPRTDSISGGVVETRQ